MQTPTGDEINIDIGEPITPPVIKKPVEIIEEVSEPPVTQQENYTEVLTNIDIGIQTTVNRLDIICTSIAIAFGILAAYVVCKVCMTVMDICITK